MDNKPNNGKCIICGGTLSIHINVSKPLDHHFGR